MTYTEDNLTEQPAIKLFESLGWQTVNCYAETFGEEGLLGRENRSEVVLVRELRQLPIGVLVETNESIIIQFRNFKSTWVNYKKIFLLR